MRATARAGLGGWELSCRHIELASEVCANPAPPGEVQARGPMAELWVSRAVFEAYFRQP